MSEVPKPGVVFRVTKFHAPPKFSPYKVEGSLLKVVGSRVPTSEEFISLARDGMFCRTDYEELGRRVKAAQSRFKFWRNLWLLFVAGFLVFTYIVLPFVLFARFIH